MRYERVYIEGIGHRLPEVVIKTTAIEKMLGRTYERLGIPLGTLENMTGVGARRFWRPDVLPSDVATQAAAALLDDTGFDRQRIGALVSTSVCKDYLEPSVAALVHGNLGLATECLNFDVGNACLGFLSGMATVANLIELGQIEAGLVVAGEGSRAVTQATTRRLLAPEADFQTYRDNLATLTLGSAAVAMLLVNTRLATGGHKLLGGLARAGTEHSRLCIGTDEGMKTDAPALLREGVALAQRTWAEVLPHLGFEGDAIAAYALHQVGRANHEAVVGALGLPDARCPRLYPEYGNVGAAGVPLTLSTMAPTLVAGDSVMLMGIGSGLNVQMMGVRW